MSMGNSGGCGCLLVAIAAVVAVIGFGYKVVVAQVMPDRGLTSRQVEAIHRVTGTWEGTYVCNGKRRAMRLKVDRARTKGADLRASFAFWENRRISGEPLGVTSLKGHHDGRTMYLVPDSWIKRPPGYVMVDVRAPVPRGEPLRMSGDLGRDGNCKGFTVTEREPAP